MTHTRVGIQVLEPESCPMDIGNSEIEGMCVGITWNAEARPVLTAEDWERHKFEYFKALVVITNMVAEVSSALRRRQEGGKIRVPSEYIDARIECCDSGLLAIDASVVVPVTYWTNELRKRIAQAISKAHGQATAYLDEPFEYFEGWS